MNNIRFTEYMMVNQKKIFETFKNKILDSSIENFDNISDWLSSIYVSSLFENNIFINKVSISPLTSDAYKSFQIQATNKNLNNECEIHIYKNFVDNMSVKNDSLLIFDIEYNELNEEFFNLLNDYNFFISKREQHIRIIVY